MLTLVVLFVGIFIANVASGQQNFAGDAQTIANTEELRRLQSAAMLEWYASNCPVNIDQSAIDEAVTTLRSSQNHDALRVVRRIYGTGVPRLREQGMEPCEMIEQEVSG